jgi:hypothetical protein
MIRKVSCDKKRVCTLDQIPKMKSSQVGRGGINVKSIDYLIPIKSTSQKKITKPKKLTKQAGAGKKQVSTKSAPKVKPAPKKLTSAKKKSVSKGVSTIKKK